jgi:hypothetical protein
MAMGLVLRHIPHIIPAVIGLAFLVWFFIHARNLPPSDLSDDQLAAWQRDHGHHSGVGIEPDGVQLAGAVRTPDQHPLDVGGAAGSGDQRHH